MEEKNYDLDKWMPRLSQLSKVLEELEVENDIFFTFEGVPAVLANIEERQIWMEYGAAKPEGEVLTMTFLAELPETEERNVELLCEVFNKESLFGTAVFEPFGNQVIFRCRILEPDLTMNGADFRLMAELFTGSIRQFEEEYLGKEMED